jgi:hypothetical protein
MSQVRQLLPTAATSFVLGAGVAGGCGYLVWKYSNAFWVSNHYMSVAYNGATRAAVLVALRHGDVDGAVSKLEALLDKDAASLATFTPTGAPTTDRRIRFLTRSMSAYRREFPSTQSNPEMRKFIERGLAVGGPIDPTTAPAN